jgi:hypothetical protein
MNNFEICIYLIIFIKICFITLAITHEYLKISNKDDSELDEKVLFWKGKFELLFKASMSFLLIYLFNPRYSRENLINYETKLLLFLFGFILLITANWNVILEESLWFKKLQTILGPVTK